MREDNLGFKLFIGLICVIFFTLFFHFRQIRLEIMEIPPTEKGLLLAQVDFEFPEEQATIVMREQALEGIGQVFSISEKQLREEFFAFETSLNTDQQWKDKYPFATYEEIYETAGALQDILQQMRFACAKTIARMRELHFPVYNFLVFSPPIGATEFFIKQDYWTERAKFSFKEALSKKLGHDVNPQTLNFVLSSFLKCRWDLINDKYIEQNYRKAIVKDVPSEFTKVRIGSRITAKGEAFSQRQTIFYLATKSVLRQLRDISAPLAILGNFLLSLLLVALTVFYFRLDQAEVLKSCRKLGLLAAVVILTATLGKVVEYVQLQNRAYLVEVLRYPLLVPFAAMLLSILLNSRIALYCSAFLSVILGSVLAFEHSRFIIANLFVSVAIIIFTATLRKRKEIFNVCGKAFFVSVPLILSFSYITDVFLSDYVLTDIGASFLFCFLTAIMVVGLLPALETIFNVMTDMTLMEYMDPGSELVKRLALETPGTYQHSLAVGNLTEAAAQAIGANELFCKVATLFHDIGKLKTPHYFTENQQPGVNIHQLLSPSESAQVIISHVKEGEMVARKYRLPQSIIQIIKEHHGTTPVYYFYSKEIEQNGGDPEKVDVKLFRYPGPKPHSKESAIIMIADTIEAASRSLEEVDEMILTEMVDRLVGDKAEDGQFDECSLSFEELGIVKKSIVSTLLLTRHLRIKYPKQGF